MSDGALYCLYRHTEFTEGCAACDIARRASEPAPTPSLPAATPVPPQNTVTVLYRDPHLACDECGAVERDLTRLGEWHGCDRAGVLRLRGTLAEAAPPRATTPEDDHKTQHEESVTDAEYASLRAAAYAEHAARSRGSGGVLRSVCVCGMPQSGSQGPLCGLLRKLSRAPLAVSPATTPDDDDDYGPIVLGEPDQLRYTAVSPSRESGALRDLVNALVQALVDATPVMTKPSPSPEVFAHVQSVADARAALDRRLSSLERERDELAAVIGTVRQMVGAEPLRNVSDCDGPQHTREIGASLSSLEREAARMRELARALVHAMASSNPMINGDTREAFVALRAALSPLP